MFSLVNKIKETSCAGKIYKAKINNYISKTGEICNKKSLRLMRKLSCPNCEECGWIEEAVQEHIACGYLLLNFEKIEHDKLYTIRTCNLHVDYETGCVDDCDLEIVPLPEKRKG